MTTLPLQTKVYTVEDLIQMGAEGEHYELVEGELVERMPPGDEHGKLASLIAKFLWDFILENEVDGAAGVESAHILALNPDTIRSPDAYYNSLSHSGPVSEGVIRVAPEIAVEVVSPSEAADEIEHKIREYLRGGTRLVWVIYPKTQTVHIRTATSVEVLDNDGVLTGGDVLPGFTLNLHDFFNLINRMKKRDS